MKLTGINKYVFGHLIKRYGYFLTGCSKACSSSPRAKMMCFNLLKMCCRVHLFGEPGMQQPNGQKVGIDGSSISESPLQYSKSTLELAGRTSSRQTISVLLIVIMGYMIICSTLSVFFL